MVAGWVGLGGAALLIGMALRAARPPDPALTHARIAAYLRLLEDPSATEEDRDVVLIATRRVLRELGTYRRLVSPHGLEAPEALRARDALTTALRDDLGLSTLGLPAETVRRMTAAPQQPASGSAQPDAPAPRGTAVATDGLFH